MHYILDSTVTLKDFLPRRQRHYRLAENNHFARLNRMQAPFRAAGRTSDEKGRVGALGTPSPSATLSGSVTKGRKLAQTSRVRLC